MGRILEDQNQGIHVEMRRESFVIYTDLGKQRIELPYRNLQELEGLLNDARNLAQSDGIATRTDSVPSQKTS